MYMMLNYLVHSRWILLPPKVKWPLCLFYFLSLTVRGSNSLMQLWLYFHTVFIPFNYTKGYGSISDNNHDKQKATKHYFDVKFCM